MRPSPSKSAWLLLALLLSTVSASADDYHYINLFVGDRASGLGGAYSAIADGPEGAYYNPAGLAFSPSVYVSVSTNAVQFKQLSYKDIWSGLSEAPIDYTRNSFSYVPSFFGTVQRSGKSGFALTLATIENDSFDQRDKISLWEPGLEANQLVNVGFVQNNTNQELGLSWGMLLGESFSLGWGGFLGYRETKTITSNVQQVEGYAFFQSETSYYRRQRFSLRPSLGVQWIPSKTVSLGLSGTVNLPFLAFDTFETISMAMAADGWDAGSTVIGTDIQVQDNTSLMYTILNSGLFASTSVNSNLGFAWFVSPSLLVSADAVVYFPLNSPIDWLQRVFTWNAALGLEWYISPNFPLRVGLFTNNANTPSLSSGAINSQDNLDLYGASFSFGYATNNFDLTVGASGSLGAGYAQILTNNSGIQRMTGYTLQVFISGSFH